MRIRTGYSFKHSVGRLNKVMDRLIEIGASAAPVSDRLSTFAFNRWSKLAEKNSLSPIFGVEIGVTAELGEKKPTLDYWTFFAISDLKDLNRLFALATSQGTKEPSLSYQQAMAAEGLIKIAGERCRLDQVQPRADLYFALSPALPKGQYLAIKSAGHKFVQSSCNNYPREEDSDLYRLTLGRSASSQTYPQHILSFEEWREATWFASEDDKTKALVNAKKIRDLCKAKINKGRMLRPDKPKTLRKMCEEGAKRLGVNLKDKVYGDRLARELKLISDKQFEDYFYIIADLVDWAKKRMIVGPARGSSCGSLVCYLLNITTIDPIPFNLIFERFIDINRSDLPDIDIDFDDQRRHLVFEYAEKKYGRDRVARLGTVMMFQPRSALKQVGMQIAAPQWMIDKVNDVIIKRSSGDARALDSLNDTLVSTDAGRELTDRYPAISMASQLEGHPYAAGQHAAGIIITEDPVTDYLAVDMRTGSVQCDKKDAEDLNLLKIDALGLTQLSVFSRTLELAGLPTISGWLEKLPLNDKAAFDVLNAQKYSGIFQFTGIALQSVARQVQINHIEDIISITALARPGPMATGGVTDWIKRKNGTKVVEYPHPLFEPHMRGTFGVVIYQEQVMTIGREIGDLSWEDVTALRKAMSKSLGKEFFDQFGDRWKAAAKKKGIPKKILDDVWDDLCAYGSWAFNRSHSVAYGIVSYWCCWLKAHYPVEFAAATLDSESDPMKQVALLRELAAEGIDYVAVDPDHSVDRWSVATKGGKKILVGPLTQVHGIGEAACKEIIEARKKGTKLRDSLAKKLVSPKTGIGTLFPIRDRVAEIVPDLRSINIVSAPRPIGSICLGEEGVVIIAVVKKINPRDENEEVNIAKRGYKIVGEPTASVNSFFYDDSGEIFCKISRWDYARLAPEFLNRGKAGKAIYAIKGNVPKGFKMISIKAIKYIGDLT